MNFELQYTKDGSVTLLNKNLNVTYHSAHGAIQESRHIFINTGLHYAISRFKEDLTIVEIGFGTGLNALLTSEEAKKLPRNIHYFGIEKFPITTELAQRLNYPEMLDMKEKEEFWQLHTCEWEKEISIHRHFQFCKFNADLNDFCFEQDIHIIYFDAFAPQSSPDMWRAEVFEALYKNMVPSACLVTFCAQGNFKRTLKHIGFKLETLQGALGKREMTRAIK